MSLSKAQILCLSTALNAADQDARIVASNSFSRYEQGDSVTYTIPQNSARRLVEFGMLERFIGFYGVEYRITEEGREELAALDGIE